MTDNSRELWKLAPELSVVDAAILLAGGDPSEDEIIDYDDRSDPIFAQKTHNHPGFLAAISALKAAIRKGKVSANVAYRASKSEGEQATWALRCESSLEDNGSEAPWRIEQEPDWKKTTVDVDDLKRWLRSVNFTACIFFDDEPYSSDGDLANSAKRPDDFADPSHDHFSAELALAVTAWKALASEQKMRRGPKAEIDAWISANPSAWLGDDPLTTTAKERVVVLVNWKKKGGAPETYS